MKELACLLILLSCPVNLFSQIDSSTYEWAMISRGDNYPDFNPNEEGLKALVISLHRDMPPEEFRKTYGWNAEKYAEKIKFLKSKDYVYENEGKLHASCMVVSDREGKELFKYAEPLAQRIAGSMIPGIDAIKSQYSKSELSQTTDFNKASFFILSNVLLDNWQISSVEKEFLTKERPLRHGKRYYFAYLQNLNPPRESFGIYGNRGFSNFGVYGNNRKTISKNQSKEQLDEMTSIGENDNAFFLDMASSFRPTLLDILRNNRAYIEEVYAKTGYSKEVSFEEFFIWWYHFIYTRATNILAEKKYLTLPEQGNFFYRYGHTPETTSNKTDGPAPAASPEVDQILERYVEAVGGKAALMRISTEIRKGELVPEKGRFAIESYADTSGRWTFSLNNDQMALQIQCQQSNCWRDRNQSDRVDPPTCVEIAAGFDVHFPLHVKDYFPALQFRGRESLADKTVVVLEGSSPQLKPVKLVFDAQSGLLVQLGSTEFQDYRECDGVRRPFVSVSPMDGKATYREIQHNRGIPSEVFKGSSHAAAQTDSK